MKNSISLILICLLLISSCEPKNVKLPLSNAPGIQDTIYNNTQIWLFFSLKNNDTVAELNRKNIISTTHWIFNIDKRLKMEQIIPHIKYLQGKREKPSLHKSEEKVNNYYSYVDTVSNKLSTVLFTDVTYITDEKYEKKNDSIESLIVTIHQNDRGVFVNDRLLRPNEIQHYIQASLDTTKIKLDLIIDKNVNYENYIHLKSILQIIENDSLIVNNKEYILLE